MCLLATSFVTGTINISNYSKNSGGLNAEAYNIDERVLYNNTVLFQNEKKRYITCRVVIFLTTINIPFSQ